MNFKLEWIRELTLRYTTPNIIVYIGDTSATVE